MNALVSILLLLLVVLLSVVALVLTLGLAFGVTTYNKLVRLRNAFKNAFAQIDVQLLRRYDLIPNLVETAKGYLRHERQTLEAVIQARGAAFAARGRAAANPADPNAMKELVGAEAALGGALGRLLAVVERYPDLKANTTMQNLSNELTATEDQIAQARQAYNDAVTRYNTARESFPTNFVAGLFHFQPAELFQIEQAEQRVAPQASFA